MKFIVYLLLPILIVFTVLNTTTLFGTNEGFGDTKYRFTEGFLNAVEDFADQGQLTNGFKTTINTVSSGIVYIKSALDSFGDGNFSLTDIGNLLFGGLQLLSSPLVLFFEPVIVVERFSKWLMSLLTGMYVQPY